MQMTNIQGLFIYVMGILPCIYSFLPSTSGHCANGMQDIYTDQCRGDGRDSAKFAHNAVFL